MNLQEHIKKALRENTSDKFLSTIKKHGLFHFLMVSQINPMIFGKYVKYEELPKEIIYRFLDETSEHSLSTWITDYYNKPLYFNSGNVIYEIQSWGGGNFSGEVFTNDGSYVSDFNLSYESFNNDKLIELFTVVLHGPFYENIYKKN